MSKICCRVFMATILWMLLVPCLGASATLEAKVSEQIRLLTFGGDPPLLALGEQGMPLQSSLVDFYRQRNHLPAWIASGQLTPDGQTLVNTLRSAAAEGLCPEDYHLRSLEVLDKLSKDYRRFSMPPNPRWLAQFDLLLTDGVLLYASHLIQGRVDPDLVHEGWRANPRDADLAKLLNDALDNHRLERALAELVPAHPGYVALRKALGEYRRISAMGGWAPVPGGGLLHPGMSDPRVPQLRERLWASGDLVPPVSFDIKERHMEGETDAVDEIMARITASVEWELPEFALVDVADQTYDPVAVRAMKRFQQRHGLAADGVVGPKTLAALNTSVEARILQIELNLERWRWLPKSLGDQHIRVNAAAFRLEVVEAGRTVMTMPVVVGTGYRKTPVFSARMSYLEFAPFWYVPPTILREDKLPLIRRNPDWVSRNHYEIIPWGAQDGEAVDPRKVDWEQVEAKEFPGMLRMKPGPWNPLGRIKFMFPNRYAIYLHDTPDRHLFSRNVRSFSSGCIRIERPLDLAQYLLEKQGWDCDRLIETMERDRPQRVDLPQSLPVHIMYWTAWVDEEGRLQLRDDLYQRDLDLELALFGDPSEVDSQAEVRYSGLSGPALEGKAGGIKAGL